MPLIEYEKRVSTGEVSPARDNEIQLIDQPSPAKAFVLHVVFLTISFRLVAGRHFA